MIISLITTISIELVQLVIGRVFDIDDIILNLFGGFLGALIFTLLDKLKDKLPDILNKEWFMNMIMILLLLFAVVYLTNLNEYFYDMVSHA